MRILPALRHRQFNLFWMGLLLAWTGNQILLWAIPWQIRDFTDNPLALGSIGLIRLTPTILFSLFAGLIADRFDRRKVVIITQSVMGATALILGTLTLTKTIQLWHIYVLLAVHTSAFIVDLPARFSLTPNIVPDQALPNALSLEVVAIQIGGIIGPIINGLIVNHLGEQFSYLVSACLFAGMILILISMEPIPQQSAAKNHKGIDWEAIKEGLNFTFTHPLILSAMLLDFLATLLTRADALLPYFARDTLGVEGTAYGFLTAAPMIGAVTAGAFLSLVGTIRHHGKWILGSGIMIGLAAVIFGSSRAYPLSLFALMLAGASDSISSILRSAIRQLHTPDRLRGRMTSVNQIFFMGGPYLGDVKSGFLGGLIGVPLAVALGGGACVLSMGWIAKRWPELWEYNGPHS